ncbi:hypothetical protein pEaSNUABM5_00148 [Erwinia phage pEa_SNUABM_5]|uniref:Uncharacterized protein n=1 Tax=Erwinia phage pEa_SNUABM_5 TaxID=2797313 RepID=A0A7T8EPH7_9CAUD|nr:hypothetical protein MPK73_gp148 [Erwinia phage pEa_SNUABM_5]QQO90290.1 hypothetical protein pEaSNUABM5_00148 [Erwinia phage pEa_SNUABM_5]
MPKISLKGIVCVGENHQQAVDNFRNTATGQGIMFFASQSGETYASQSGADIYKPDGSQELLTERPDLVEKAAYASTSSNEDVRANYTICLDGCGTHIVSESTANVTHCPSCSADLGEISDERITDHLATVMDTQSVSHDGLVAVGATAEEAQQNFVHALSSATSFVAESGTSQFKAAMAVKFDPYTGADVTSVSQASDEVVTALSSSIVGDSKNVEVHMYSCSANCENPFTVSSDENPVFCAHCSSVLIDIQPDAQASLSGEDDEGADIDILDDEEDEDLDVDDEDLDEEESDSSAKNVNSLSSDDLDEDEEEDDEDLDEDEEEEEDDLDDLDDLGEDDFEDEDEDDSEFLDDAEDLEEEDELDDDEEEDDEDFDSESAVSDDEEEEDDDLLIDDEDLDELDGSDDEIDDSEFESDSAAQPVARTFDSLSTVLAAHTVLDPALVSISRNQSGAIPTLHMFYDGMPIARATLQSVSNAVGEEIALKSFKTDNFVRAVNASLSDVGVVETCSEMGFEPFKIEMPVDRLLANEADSRINAATSDVQQTISASVDSYQERFVAALSTAMLGVTKGFWNGVSNPVVESLCSALQSAGVKDPRKVVERAFFSHSSDFLTVALSQANSLMNKSEVAQNEIAEAVSSSVGISRSNDEGETRQQPVQQEQPKPSAAQRLDIQRDEAPVQSQSSASVDSFTAKAVNLLRF